MCQLSSSVFGVSLSILAIDHHMKIYLTSLRTCRDTVDSVGLIPKRLPFTTSNTIVRTFRHAVALDERRAKFKANLWNRPNTEEAKLGSNYNSTTAKPSLSSPETAGGLAPPAAHQSTISSDDSDSLDDVKEKGGNGSEKKGPSTKNISPDNEKDDKGSNHRNSNGHRSLKGRKEDEGDRVLNTFEKIYSEKSEQTTDIEEVWFAVRVFLFFKRQTLTISLFCF